MAFLDLIIRVAGVTLLLMQVALLWRDARQVRTAQFGMALAASLACVMITDGGEGFHAPRSVIYALTPISMISALFTWWFSQSLFDDEFRISPWQWGAAAIWTVLGTATYLDFVNGRPVQNLWPVYMRSLMAIGFAVHIVYLALSGRKNDLVERRRRIRTYFALAIMTVFIFDLFHEYLYGWPNVPIWSSIAQYSLYLPVIIWGYFWLTRIDANELMFERAQPRLAPAEPKLSPKETLLEEKLQQIMGDEKAYLEPELSIASLADRVGAPEHQLRVLINKSMGHRNFRAFLNQYRLEAAKTALSDPDKAALPILTIAMDSGFASLSSFNRAFKLDADETPTTFRERALANSVNQN